MNNPVPPPSPERHNGYRHAMAREAKDFAIDAYGLIAPSARATPVRFGPSAVVPSRFTTWVVLAKPRLRIDLELQVFPGGQTEIREMTLSPGVDGAARIASSTLRRIPVDQIVRAVLAKAAEHTDGTVIDRSDVTPGGYQLPGDPEDEFWISPPPAGSQRATWAAQIYRKAWWAGNRAPTEAVAAEMHVSRSQASRYIKVARDEGLLPRPGEKITDPDHERFARKWDLVDRTIRANREAMAGAATDEDKAVYAERVDDFTKRLNEIENEWRRYRAAQRGRGVTPEELPPQVATLDIQD